MIYDYCKPAYEDTINLYRWQDVACCIEHGTEYFKLVEASRSNEEKPSDAKAQVTNAATTVAKSKEDAAGRKKENKFKPVE